MTTYRLYWTRADRQGDMDMGEYPTREAAEAAIPECEAEMLAQCATTEPESTEERAELMAGSWDVEEKCTAEET